MSHSRANNESADLEHLELTEELLGSTTDDSQIEPPSPSPHRDSRRVSINSQASTSSTGTIKPSYHHPHILSEPSPRGAATRMSTTGSSSSAIRPKPSFRHSSAHLGEAGNGGGGRRRRQGGARPASTRSSIRRRNRSSDVDEDEEDEAYDGHPAYLDEYSSDLRSNHSHLRRGSSRRSVRLEDHDARSFEVHDRHDDDDEGSDAEPLTLKDRQETLNQSHVFGIKLWKPALYKKNRSVTQKVDSALHSQPSSDFYLSFGNLLWTIVFGWWMSIICLTVAIILYLTPFGGSAYGRVILGLSYYLLWPFGQYVERELSPGELRSDDRRASAFSGDYNSGYGRLSQLSPLDESRPLLSWSNSNTGPDREREPPVNLFVKIATAVKRFPQTVLDLGFGGIVYYFFYYLLIGPMHLFVSSLCWFLVISIPMGKLTYVLATHLHGHPLRLHFKRGSSLALAPQRSEILLCTYDAIGLQYYKYTYDGTNIIFINLMPVVFFVILDDYLLTRLLGHHHFITSPAFIFSLGLTSVIPLSYFIGMAVSSISAQSSLGMGAVINATFGSIIEIILYSVALTQGKSQITEGALIGSFLAGLLLMPGFSMISGAIKKKEQKFNAKSAGVTATMLIMSLIGVLTPTLFYQIHGGFELRCEPCPEAAMLPNQSSCQRCYQQQPNPHEDAFFQKHVRPLMFFCCIILPSAYLIGIWFSLRTHVKQIWHEPQQPSVRDSSLYKKLLPIHIIQQLLHYGSGANGHRAPHTNPNDAEMGHFTSPSGQPNYQATSLHGGIGHDQVHPPPHSAPLPGASAGVNGAGTDFHPAQGLLSSLNIDDGIKSEHGDEEEEEAHGGHDSPNWSKGKSATVLLGCTVLYSIIAEILVGTVDAVSSIDEKLLGLTLFALVPNVTEFMNAISFAMYGNIALSMEIGSAYALQVCLIQIPAMVAISAWLNYGLDLSWKFAFNLVFPRWDIFSMLFSVFLLTYTYIEGKSNYFKGSILILSYVVLMAGYYYAPESSPDVDFNFLPFSPR
ncbi:hypothetical protein CPC16_010528 [Podila verticillata]|nr:hypothetical protein CPC16_010528 [Podila verticillata]KFH65975.1 hypothetical protein MVEG_08077 [Podila verticillata NRRL 6337]